MHHPRILCITGATRGLGFALVERALALGDSVIGTFRDETRAKDLFNLARQNERNLHVVQLDVADEYSCATLVKRLPSSIDHIDVLVNNAGINSTSRDIADPRTAYDLGSITTAALDRMMHTNAFGPIFVTRALLPFLARSFQKTNENNRSMTGLTHHIPIVVNLSSRRGSLEEKTTGGNYGYCISKAALNMATRALAADLEPMGIVVVAVHPGAVRTSMAQPDARTSPAEAASRLIELIDRLTPANHGFFLESDGTRRPW
ncbi:MAG: SDR family oxidoreductase [Polyangiaceae bacterium]|nr:SDR family oxidoreductase [Polyangiaceae bacterium]